MGSFLLSFFSAESLSWVGFVVLGMALVGEAGAALIAIISNGEKLHLELAFILAIVAAAGYAVEVADPGVTIRLHAAKQGALSPMAKALQAALQRAHIKTAVGKAFGNDANDAVNGDVVIVVGVRIPAE